MHTPLKTSVNRFYSSSFFGNFSADLAIWSFYLMEVHDLSLAQAVFAHTLIFLVLAVTDLPTGAWADLFGRKRIVLLGYFFRICGAVLTLCAESYETLLLAAASVIKLAATPPTSAVGSNVPT